jgi:hypothetical protein
VLVAAERNGKEGASESTPLLSRRLSGKTDKERTRLLTGPVCCSSSLLVRGRKKKHQKTTTGQHQQQQKQQQQRERPSMWGENGDICSGSLSSSSSFLLLSIHRLSPSPQSFAPLHPRPQSKTNPDALGKPINKNHSRIHNQGERERADGAPPRAHRARPPQRPFDFR